VARVLITGSTTGLGRAAANELVSVGHAPIFHARTEDRAGDLPTGAAVVIGDLSEHDQVVDIATRSTSSATSTQSSTTPASTPPPIDRRTPFSSRRSWL
jgi:uncharacterized protein YbjT (DUF2867 family)